MKISKLPNGKWKLHFRPNGTTGKEVSRRFDTRGEAERFYKHVMAEVASGKPWNPKPEKLDGRTLSEVVTEWYHVRGFSLKSGSARKDHMLYVCRVAGNPLARHISPATWADIRSTRADGGVSVNTLNHDLAHFKGVFTDLIAAGKWPSPNPLASVKKEKISQKEMWYLSHEQIAELLEKLQLCKSRDPYLIAKLCLSTGARWGEAESVTANRLKNGCVYYPDTKNGKGRTIPIAPELTKELLENRMSGFDPLFARCYTAFRKRLQQCSFTLPPQQSAHVLRHTFASHFLQNGGNIRTLQHILGHSSLETTMVYAHFLPDHLQATLKMNPLAMMLDV